MTRLVVEESQKSWAVELAGVPRATVGRGRASTVVIADTAASREHCAVERDGAEFWLVDLGSRNGTFVNGQRVQDRVRLRAGDRVAIGAARIAFEDPAPASAPTHAAALARDPDTGLLSFAYLRAELGRLLEAGAKVALAKLDVDGLGLVNSVLGTEVGDAVITAVARLVEAAALGLDPQALVAHEEGGRVLVLVPGADAARGREVAEAARARVATAAQERRLVTSVTLSGGVAAATGGTARALLGAAESALAEAKREGRDRVAVAGAPRVPSPSAVKPPKPPFDIATTEPGADGRVELEPAAQRALGLIARVLASDLDLDGLAELALSVLVRETGASRGLLVLRDPSGALKLGAGVTSGAGGPGVLEPASHSLIRAALERRDGILMADVRADSEHGENESALAAGARSVVAAPIPWGEDVIGAIYLEDSNEAGRFDQAALELVRAFGKLVAGPLRRGLLHSRTLDELARARVALRGTPEDDERLFARYSEIVGRSAAMRKLLRLLDRLADRPLPVLVTGESGTGKELVARALHTRSRRARGAFVAENVAALSEQLLEAELFGCVKGAFTGADRDRAGLLDAAHEGTLFLDEVGDMSLRLQAKLLRFLQDGEFRALGDDKVKKVSVRIVAATNRDLRALMEKGEFREDLYYRLAVLRVEVPALRDRREDVPHLVEFFSARASRELGKSAARFSREALSILAAHPWPGNVRELENEVRRLVALGHDPVSAEQLSSEITDPRGGAVHAAAGAFETAVDSAADALIAAVRERSSLKETIEALERELIAKILHATRGNRSEAARILDLSRPGLLGKLRRMGLDKGVLDS
jgi:diguanylate cyclase (GGDEF)-like protein